MKIKYIKNKLTLGILIITFIFLGFFGFVIGCGGGGGASSGSGSSSSSDSPPRTPTPTSGFTFTPTPVPAASVLPNQVYAVLVGIADYPGTQNDLDYTVKDADDFESALKNSGLWNNATIVKLTDLTVGNVAKSKVQDAVQTASTLVGSNDMFVFFYSGHGTNTGGLGWLVCYDGIQSSSGRISQNDLQNWLEAFPADSYKFVVIDSCYSGLFVDKKVEFLGKVKFVKVEGSDLGFKGDFTKSLSIVNNLICITASAGSELAVESSDLLNGAITHYVVQGFGAGSTIGPADANSNGSITATEDYNYSAPLTINFNSSQHPQFRNTSSNDLVLKKN